MNAPNPCEFRGPLEEGTWPDTLLARVVTPGDDPRVRGYDVESDLALYYRASDVTLLALTSELPTPDLSAAFEVAQVYLAPVSVAHASTHAAVVARLCGASASATIGVAASALAEQARVLVSDHEELLAALPIAGSELPACAIATSEPELTAFTRLEAALARVGFTFPTWSARPTRLAALIYVLYSCGLTRREQLEAVIVQSRLMCTLAEAFAERKANFNRYPVNLPRFRYEEQP